MVFLQILYGDRKLLSVTLSYLSVVLVSIPLFRFTLDKDCPIRSLIQGGGMGSTVYKEDFG